MLTVGCRSDRYLNPSLHTFAQGNTGSLILLLWLGFALISILYLRMLARCLIIRVHTFLLLPLFVRMDNLAIGSLLPENAPHLWWLFLPLLKLCLIKYQLVLSIVFLLIVMQGTDIPVNTCYICQNYVHYLSLQVYQWSLS